MFEAEQAAEVVRGAANTDINTIFGSVINENLSDEVIVTVIATGFDKKKPQVVQEPVFSNVSQTRRTAPIKEEINYGVSPELLDNDDDGSSGEYDLPPFLRERNY